MQKTNSVNENENEKMKQRNIGKIGKKMVFIKSMHAAKNGK